jgi:hypothetical protein
MSKPLAEFPADGKYEGYHLLHFKLLTFLSQRFMRSASNLELTSHPSHLPSTPKRRR